MYPIKVQDTFGNAIQIWAQTLTDILNLSLKL